MDSVKAENSRLVEKATLQDAVDDLQKRIDQINASYKLRTPEEEDELAQGIATVFAKRDALRAECNNYQKELVRVVGLLRANGVEPCGDNPPTW